VSCVRVCEVQDRELRTAIGGRRFLAGPGMAAVGYSPGSLGCPRESCMSICDDRRAEGTGWEHRLDKAAGDPDSSMVAVRRRRSIATPRSDWGFVYRRLLQLRGDVETQAISDVGEEVDRSGVP
jgi:hypothetical protein